MPPLNKMFNGGSVHYFVQFPEAVIPAIAVKKNQKPKAKTQGERDLFIDSVAKKYSGMGGVEDYRAFARELISLEKEACAQVCDAAKEKSQNSLIRSAFTIAASEIRSRNQN